MKLKVKVLSRKLGGGGGTTTKEVSTIPKEFIPYLTRVGDEATKSFEAGQLGKVAGASANQEAAFGMGKSIQDTTKAGLSALEDQQFRLASLAQDGGRDALMESAAFQAAKEGSKIGNQYGAAGTLGSARQGIQTGAMQAELADRASQQAFSNRMAAEQGLGSSIGGASSLAAGGAASLAKLGDEQRTIAQQEADKDYQALQRFSSTVYGNPARQQATQEGGGK